ncbi:magnesium chelatase [Dyadobacter beijingensis]|uniref:Magnesium chelatase n=1 Tax=Dyadobacter beijingensis TaxID=365489 RepID=A0ABQ2HLC6_9BACT|nr:magnesium chelatase subunit D family protein [Dyadobacter beijingensis]GGM83681.1 magnesium chelatase [Dyadobacter beijingensis]
MTSYPFAAIVGQEKLKKALLLCAINPGIGGVLIKGEKGTAKTTAVRGLASVMPHPESADEPVPFVDLPLGASEDRVLGSLDIEAILANKTKKLLPGLLAGAHEGILYIDEVNLLADHLVDVLLDVSVSGVNTVQREGLSVSHPARFVLIGTMNPEEGNLRPQFLDRFGLMVEVGAQATVDERTEVVRRRIAFERDSKAFEKQWDNGQEAIRMQIARARKLLPGVQMPDGLLKMISQLCIEWGVSSLRADIFMYKTAITIAALNSRDRVSPDDVREAAELVLMHRRGRNALPPSPGSLPESPHSDKDKLNGGGDHAKPTMRDDASASEPDMNGDDRNADGSPDDSKGECGEGNCSDKQEEYVAGVYSGMVVPELLPDRFVERPELTVGTGSKAKQTIKGFQVRAVKTDVITDLAVNETILHAIVRNPEQPSVVRGDLHQKIRNGKAGHLILFVVDASGSMAAGQRMEAVKGSVMSLLEDAYQKRNSVGVIAFRGVEANVLLEPTRNIDLAQQALEKLPTGGRTPLPHALQLAGKVLGSHPETAHMQPLLVLLSDGKANVPLPGGNGDAWGQSLRLASEIPYPALVLDTESGYIRYGKARELANALRAEYVSLHELSANGLTETILDRIVI